MTWKTALTPEQAKATRYFYAIDHANDEQKISAFKSKTVRDTFVADGNRRFSQTAKKATALCKKAFECTAQEAVMRGFI